MSLPEFAVVDVFNAEPDLGFAAALVPVSTEVTIVETKHLRGEPGRNVDTVRDMPDWNLVFRFVFEESGPHGARDLAVQCRDSVGAP